MARWIWLATMGLWCAIYAAPSFASDPGFTAARPLFSASGAGNAGATGSLFDGQPSGRQSLFDHHRDQLAARAAQGQIAELLSLIARAEAGPAGYDAVQHGARIRPPRPPTQMTLGEIFAWIDATPGQPHAIGRYQFIPDTLARVVRLRDLPARTRFTPEVQDVLALILLEDAGLAAFQSGALPRTVFMENLAEIWAGLPLQNGRSYYHGYAGNRATMTWASFEAGMSQIWPRRR